MNTTQRVVVFVFLGFLIAALSIGIEAYNRNPRYKETNMPSFNYLVVMLSLAVAAMAYTAFDFYKSQLTPVGLLQSAFVAPTAS
jgi:hypothetical protein